MRSDKPLSDPAYRQLECLFNWWFSTKNIWSFAMSVNPNNSSRITGDCVHIDGLHYNDVIMGAMASQITSLTVVYSTVYSGADQRKHQSSASLAFVRGIHRWPVNSPHKGPVARKMFPFDDVIMNDSKVETSLITHRIHVSFVSSHRFTKGLRCCHRFKRGRG